MPLDKDTSLNYRAQCLNQEIALNPNNVPLLHQRALILEALGQFKKALADYTLLLSLEKHASESLLLKCAGIHDKLEDYKAALHDYNVIIKINSNNSMALLGRSDSLTKLGEFNLAAQDLESIINSGEASSYVIDKYTQLLSQINPASKSKCIMG